MNPLPTLSFGEYQLVYNMLSFAIAAMLGSFVFFVLARQQLTAKYRPALVMSALVVGIAAYHYIRIFESWGAAYALEGSSYVATGEPFNDAYRYVDWLLTVPLLLAELVAVMGLARAKRAPLMAKLSIAAVLMILLGYPGEITQEPMMKHVWGIASSVPFVYILYVLWGELGKVIERESDRVRSLFKGARLMILGTWGFYPIAYLLTTFEVGGAFATVGVQVGYSIADVAAKCGYGVLIYAIARAKMEAEGVEVADATGQPVQDSALSAAE